MMAFADDEGGQRGRFVRHRHGVKDEYILQRPGDYYFFEEGKKRGVKMQAPLSLISCSLPACNGFSRGHTIW